MVVMTIKKNRKWIVLGILTAVCLAILAVALARGVGGEQWAVAADLRYSLSAEGEAGRIGFLQQFGWTVDPEPVEVAEVTIPAQFDEVYERYNQIQQEQGLDLTNYAGKTCKRWVYEVQNYPRQDQRVLATLLIYDGRVIGGDIGSANLDGFMTSFLGEHGLMEQTETETSDTAAPAKETAALPEDAYPID